MKHDILLVEDESDQRKMLSSILKDKGYKVITAINGDDALKKIEKGSFDLVITDIQMPKKNGIELCKDMRINHPYIPILVITGSIDLEQAIELINLRVSGLLIKPFLVDEFVDKVINSLYNSKIREVLRKYAKMAKLGELTASIAHELRNATTSSSLAVNLLQNSKIIKQDKKLSEYVDTFKNSITRLNQTLSHLLGYSKSNDKDSVINLKNFFDTLIVLNTDRIRVQDIIVNNLIEDVFLNTVEDSLQIIFLNLIENALHSMKDKGILKITAKQNNKNTIISVTDNGMGISESDQTKIFNAFYTTKANNGTGLGLAIVKGEVNRLGGSITFKSIEGKGTTFTVTIPK